MILVQALNPMPMQNSCRFISFLKKLNLAMPIPNPGYQGNSAPVNIDIGGIAELLNKIR